MVRCALIAALVVGAAGASTARAQAPPTPPDDYALINARIVTAPGRVIERGTVVVQDGRITAVGPSVAVPATAIRVDLEGRTVYPGLIDAAASVGLPTTAPTSGQGGNSAGNEVRPDRSAAAEFAPSAAQLEAVRNGGVTVLGLAWDGGIFPGRTAAVTTLGHGSPVLRAPVSQQVLLGRRRGAYPGTLMGALAYVEQSFLDAQWGARARASWERQPAGPRPAFNAEVRELEPAATGSMPVWLHAEAERDLKRVIDLAQRSGVREYVLVGAQEGWLAADALRATGRPVIVSLDFPRADQITGRAFELHVSPVSGEDTAGADADSAAARRARGNAAALVRAGVPIALSTYGMDSPSRLRERVRDAIAAGLSADEALRAVTVTPARILGVEAAVGTIDTGKLANLVVVNGDLFGEDTRIEHVFVEGVKHDVPAPTQRAAAQRGAGAPGGVVGSWTGEIDGPTGMMQFVLDVRGGADALTGTLTSEMGAVELRGEGSGGEFTLRGTAAPPGMTAVSITITGRATGDDLRGTLSVQGMATIPFTARRRNPGDEDQEAVR